MLNNSKFKIITGDNVLSDHRFLIVSCNINNNNNNNHNKSHTADKFTKINYEKVAKNLISLKTDSFDNFHNSLQDSYRTNSIIVYKNKKYSNNRPWFDDNLRTLKAIRDKFYKLSRKFSHVLSLKDDFHYYKKLLSKQIVSSKSRFFSEKLEKNIGNPKKIWSCIGEIINNTTKKHN
jgi:hypothetical protein